MKVCLIIEINLVGRYQNKSNLNHSSGAQANIAIAVFPTKRTTYSNFFYFHIRVPVCKSHKQHGFMMINPKLHKQAHNHSA